MKQTNPIFKVYRKTGSSPDKSTWQYELRDVHSWTELNFPITGYRFDLYAMGGCGELTVSAGQDLGWTYNDRVDVDILGAKKYSGYVTQIPIDGTQEIYNYIVTGFVAQLEWSYVEEYNVQAIYIQEAIRDVVKTYVMPYTDIKYKASLLTMTVNDINDYAEEKTWDGIIDNLDFSWASPAQILETLRQFLGQWDYGVDENQYLYFKKRRWPILQRYFVGTGPTLSFLPTEDASPIKNILHLDCGAVSNGDKYLRKYIDQTSIDNYGHREDRKTLESSFPLYLGYNLAADATITANGFASGSTHPERAIDGDIETYFDSIESQKSGAILFSKLNLDASITSPLVGEAGIIVGTPTYAVDGKWAGGEKAMTPGASDYVKWPNSDLGFDAKKGACEFWWKCPENDPSHTIGFFTTIDDDDAEGTPATNGGMVFDLYGSRLRLTARSERSSAGQSTASPVMTWVAGQWYHIAAAWDSSGEDLAKLIGANQLRTSAFWIDGVLISYSRGKYTAPTGGKYVRFGYSTPTGATGDFSYLKLYDRPNAQWDMGQYDGQYCQYLDITLPGDKQIGQITIRSSPGTASDIENEEYAKSLRVTTLPVSGGNADWRIIYDGPNSQTDLSITALPYPPTNIIRIEITASDPNAWRIYEIDIREMWVNAIDRWAGQWILDNKNPQKSGVLTLAEVSAIPDISERVAIHDLNGKVYDYITTHVVYESSANTSQVELGEKEKYISPVLRQIYRKMIEMDHTESADINQTSSGTGYVPQSIPPSAVGSVSGDQVLSGVLKSRNYVVNVSGMTINLESAKIIVYEPGGIEIISAGGLTVKSGGDITIEDGGDLIFSGSNGDWLLDTVDYTDTWNYTDLQIYPNSGSYTRIWLGSNRAGAKQTRIVNISASDTIYLLSSVTPAKGLAISGQSINPNSDADTSLGHVMFRFKDLYLSGTAIIEAGATISGLTLNVAIKTGAYTATATDDIIQCNGTFTITLPTASGITGKIYIIKNMTAGIITVDADGSETIDSETTVDLDPWDSISIYSGGTNWRIF